MEISKEHLLWMYEKMKMSRLFEERMQAAYMEGKQPVFNIGSGPVPGEMHLSNGQEPAAVGICVHLKKEDTVTAPHRPHHHAIAKNVDLNKMTAEIFGKKTGLGKGKGGHMHLFDPEVKFSCGGIVAAGIPHAVGAALAAKKKGKDWVAVSFIGEGAANAGAFHESLNLASLWHLPLIVVIEDNSWGISVPKSESTCVPSNDVRAAAYGIKGYLVKDNDPFEMYKVSKEAVERARKGGGPSIIEIETYRFLGHFQGDPELYRDKEEVPSLLKKDPINRVMNFMIEKNLSSKIDFEKIDARIAAEINNAYQFAMESELPHPEEALEDVFV
ncbi:MAG: thiamine pyrophosphate-dependent dehydrogenase E1 component subunit alpha [Cyclobacteriaceae bacterium]|nr:thiamine pyrophosphate-dependent dehydrogenase E1 component subunit alpha [Cyclobacteriaceae bacterium]